MCLRDSEGRPLENGEGFLEPRCWSLHRGTPVKCGNKQARRIKKLFSRTLFCDDFRCTLPSFLYIYIEPTGKGRRSILSTFLDVAQFGVLAIPNNLAGDEQFESMSDTFLLSVERWMRGGRCSDRLRDSQSSGRVANLGDAAEPPRGVPL